MTTLPSSAASTDPRARRWGVFAKYAGLLLVGFVVAPYVFTAITGLIGLGVAAAICVGYWMAIPAVATWAGNMRLKLVKGEAARNPVETLQNEYQRQCEALDVRKTAVGRLNGQIATFEDKLDVIGQKYGKQEPSYLKMAQQLKDLKRVAKNREDKWQAAYVQVKKFEQEIEKAGMIWEASIAAAAAQETSGLTEEDLMAKLKTDTSLDTIRESFNTTLASLDTDLMQSDAEKMVNVTPHLDALPSSEEGQTPYITAETATETVKTAARRTGVR